MDILWPNIASEPEIHVQENKGDFYTVIISDPDAGNPSYIHLLYRNATLEGKDTVFSYQPPQPPNNEWHRYIVSVYNQNKVRLPVDKLTQRSGFDLNTLALSSRNLIATKTFKSNGITIKS
jgi:phosphatidylethanolamine-binding protein (PEBP) family uncharacterized protein